MSILDILEAHRTLASAPDDKVCACDRTWRPDAEYRAHVAQVLEQHERERCYEAWREGVSVLDPDAVDIMEAANPYSKEASNGRD